MDPEMEVGERSEMKVEASTSKENGNFTEEYQLMKHTRNNEDCKADMQLVEQTGKTSRNADLEINIMKCTNSGRNELAKSEWQDTAECSSSFDGIDSVVKNVSTLSESEVLSNFRDDAASALDFDGFGEIYQIKKKRLTTHWRSFIQPLMWRCKLAELQIKKFQSQAQKYERKLEEYGLGKQLQLENSALEGVGVKSLPFPCTSSRYAILRRKRRRRAEAAMDIAAYMSQHNLFSYYENKKYFANRGFMVDELKDPATVPIDNEFWVTNKRLCLETGDSNNSVEHILQKIDFLQSQVTKLKSRANKVMSENVAKSSSTDSLSLPMQRNALIGSLQNAASPPATGDRVAVGAYIASQLVLEYNMGNVLVPESAVTSHRGKVSDVNGSTDYFADANINGEDDVLIDNHRVKEETSNFEEVKNQPIHRPFVLRNDGLGSSTPPLVAEPDLPPDEQPLPKIHSISKLTAPKNKRKRGNRKGAGRQS